ncbi:hypothetical protein [Proteus terrae]|uniref:hypothetical protein n=1 Tax=Proteus terrae TaxID=1574161 RepID=UPI00288A3AD5|nr:hypothetical protein [Proteus terrae]
MRNSNPVYFFVEGETEEHFLKDLRKSEYILPKKILKFNLWDGTSRKLKGLLSSAKGTKPYFFIIYDTDVVSNIDNFKDNLNLLHGYSGTIFLVQQNFNLEDELMHACNCSMDTLCDAFLCRDTSNREFKRNVLRCDKMLKKLKVIGFDHVKMWSKNKELLSELKSFSEVKNSTNKKTICISDLMGMVSRTGINGF